MIPPRIWPFLALAVLLGCGRDKPPKPPDASVVLPNLPLPPNPTLVSQSGGADVLMVTYSSPSPVPTVEAYYQSVFGGAGWRLVSRTAEKSGAVVMLAEQKGPPLWVRIRKAPDGNGTLVDLAGAVTSTGSPAPAAKPAS